MLEGSVRKSGNRVRVNAQLVSANDGAHSWSERFDRLLADVFEIPDEIAGLIAETLTSRLTPRSQTKMSCLPLVSPATMSLLSDEKATKRPLGEIEAPLFPMAPSPPLKPL